MRNRWLGAAVVVAALTALGLQSGIVARTGFVMGDFRAFYCAAKVASQGADPYRTEPLRSCETALGMTRFFQKNPGVTIPAPLPGYAIAALIPLALLPFSVAAVIWTVLLFFAWYACIATLSRFAGVGWEIALAIFALSLGMLSLPFGEVVPLSLAGICIAAYCAWSGRPKAAAIAAAGSMIEPHLGLPVCVALAWWRPATRLPLTIACALLAMLSLATLGVATNVEYFTSVLPAHALSEVSRDTQFSLTAALAGIGVAPSVAVSAGTVWYLAMLVAGTVVAGFLAKKWRDEAFLVCVPPAFAVLGGTFIHVTQIAAALPAAALLAAHVSRSSRNLTIVALLALSVPWVWAISPALLVAPLVPIAYLSWRYWGSLTPVLIAAVAAAGLIFGLSEIASAAPHAVAQGGMPAIDPRLAEASWSIFTQKSSTHALGVWMLRIPTWSGLALLLVLLVREAAVRWSAAAVSTVAIATICTVLPIGAQFYGDIRGGALGVDLRAYYCAAGAQRAHHNPYLAESVYECEHAAPQPFYRPPAGVTVPAPYPPYALALFSPLTLLPFSAAALLWWALLATALAASAYALASILKRPFLVAWAVLVLSVGLLSLSPGNVLPIALAALLLGTLALVKKSYFWAAAALALAMVEPHVALPAAVAAFIALPAMRLPLAVALAAITALSFAAGGFTQNLAYLTSVLPAHALSEISRDNQFSLSTVVAAFGVPDSAAAMLGTLSYAVMTVFGVVVGLRLTERYRDVAFVVLIPAAFALLGGSFVHSGEIAAAVPAGLLLYVHAKGRREWAFAALLLLAIPWMQSTSAAMLLAPLFPIAYVTAALWPGNRTLTLGIAAASLALIIGLWAFAAVPVHSIHTSHHYPPIDPRLAEASWRQFVLGNSTNRIAMWLLRLPTWAGLFALVATATILGGKTANGFVGDRLSESPA